MSVGGRIIHVLKRLYRTGRAAWESLFEESADRGELVATFLAVLELVKAGRITVEEDEVLLDRTRQPKHARGPGEGGAPSEEPN